ncbi:hypothetical protein TYRP_020009 [Tyrophagus putrescentiae]|nr:hypothetical protein TYRP_020009 [Tyrophagus putrescentiae]
MKPVQPSTVDNRQLAPTDTSSSDCNTVKSSSLLASAKSPYCPRVAPLQGRISISIILLRRVHLLSTANFPAVLIIFRQLPKEAISWQVYQRMRQHQQLFSVRKVADWSWSV